MDILNENVLGEYHQHLERHTRRQLPLHLSRKLIHDWMRPARPLDSVTVQ